jgi:glyoxylase-like metal-dependent hydrolase (beta-lactamase superfamily II)
MHDVKGEFSLSLEQIKEMVINICSRIIKVLHTLGHSLGHVCFWEEGRKYLFTGDLVYKDTLFAYYRSPDPQAYLESLEKMAALPVERVFPAHHSLDICPEILIRMQNAFKYMKAKGKLKHGT